MATSKPTRGGMPLDTGDIHDEIYQEVLRQQGLEEEQMLRPSKHDHLLQLRDSGGVPAVSAERLEIESLREELEHCQRENRELRAIILRLEQNQAQNTPILDRTQSQEVTRRGRLLPPRGYSNSYFSNWQNQFVNFQNEDIPKGALVEPLKRTSICIPLAARATLKIAMCVSLTHDVTDEHEEVRAVEEVVKKSGSSAELTYLRSNARVSDIEEAFRSDCSVLIIGGHHSAEKGLKVADGYVEDERLVQMIATSRVNLLIFTFCFAEELANLLVVQVPHVYAVFSLSHEFGLDDAAALLTKSALEYFIRGEDVVECFRSAVRSLIARKDEMTLKVLKKFEKSPSHFTSLRCKAVERKRTIEERLKRVETFLDSLSCLEELVNGDKVRLKAAFLKSEQLYDKYGDGWLPYRNKYNGKLHEVHYAPGKHFYCVDNRPEDEEWSFRNAIFQTQLCFTRLLKSTALRGDLVIHPFSKVLLNIPDEGYDGFPTVYGFTPSKMSKEALTEFGKIDPSMLPLSELYNEELVKLRAVYDEIRLRLIGFRAELVGQRER